MTAVSRAKCIAALSIALVAAFELCVAAELDSQDVMLAVQPHLATDEVVHSIGPVDSWGAVPVFVRPSDDLRGGRKFQVWSTEDSLVVKAAYSWVACDRGDPQSHVSVHVPITTQLADDIVNAAKPQLNSDEIIVRVGPFNKPGSFTEVDGRRVPEAMPGVYTVRVQLPEASGGRLLKATVSSDSIHVVAVGVYEY